ncbi:26S proteasome subunit Rpn5 [Acrasis kona]|uniref:26S proteasome subunit Rpn5 n=1 Tax=Acrasis kona TaxID=1008807 RepID=A0AAW2ZQP7_9EUKA
MSTDTEKKPEVTPTFTEKKKEKEVDYTKETDAAIEKAQQIVKSGPNKLQEALDQLMIVEKQTRMGGDAESTWRIVTEVIKLCGDQQAWTTLNDYIQIITKKRSQNKTAITKLVQEAMNYIDKTPSKEVKTELINTLRQVSEGKIYVEVERARLIKVLADMKEKEGNIAEAADLLQDVQVETIGSMEAPEKIDFILEQMRLVLDKKDYVRSVIISKKITPKSLVDTNHQDLKIRFYNLMLRYYNEKSDYLEMCRAHQAIYNTPKVQDDKSLWVDQLQQMVSFVILSPFDHEQSDLTHRILEDKKLEESELTLYKNVLKKFASTHLINWPEFESGQGAQLKKHQPALQQEKRWADLKQRVTEHNVRIVSKYYSRIATQRLADLLYLAPKPTEDVVAKMVSSKTIAAKIDRIDNVITFKQQVPENMDILNDWSHDIVELLNLVEKTNHLINKEKMRNQASKKVSAK